MKIERGLERRSIFRRERGSLLKYIEGGTNGILRTEVKRVVGIQA